MHDIDRTQLGREYEMDGEQPYQSEEEQATLAAELMELETEEEFENFLSNIFGKVAEAVGGHISAPTGRSLGSLLKGAARHILPIAGPSSGQTDEMEAEPELEAEMEEREWEAANTFVKLAEEAAQIAAQSPPQANPTTTATDAVTQAAQTHAPALVAGPPPSPRVPLAPFPQAPRGLGRRRSGRWIRRGNHIVLLGV